MVSDFEQNSTLQETIGRPGKTLSTRSSCDRNEKPFRLEQIIFTESTGPGSLTITNKTDYLCQSLSHGIRCTSVLKQYVKKPGWGRGYWGGGHTPTFSKSPSILAQSPTGYSILRNFTRFFNRISNFIQNSHKIR